METSLDFERRLWDLYFDRYRSEGIKPRRILLSPRVWEIWATWYERAGGNAKVAFEYYFELEPVMCPDCDMYVPSSLSPIGGMG